MSHNRARAIISAILTMMVLYTAGSVGGKVEGYLFPVVIDVRVASAQESGAWTRITGSFVKIRNCSFADMKFTLVGASGTTALLFQFDEGPKIRLPGRDTFGPWLVQGSVSQFEGQTQATVYHRCHPFWLTETHFYP